MATIVEQVSPCRVVAALFVNWSECTVLMAQRPATVKRPSMWEYPGGKVEKVEDPLTRLMRLETQYEALMREMGEELGSRIRIEYEVGHCYVPFEEGGANITLFLCEALDEMRPLASQELRYVDPEFAIRSLPCVPSTYLLYPRVTRLLARGPQERGKTYGL